MSALARCLVCAPLVLATRLPAQAPRGPLTLDSARAILGNAPVLIPDANVLEVRRPFAHYPQIVIVEVLASGDTVALIERPRERLEMGSNMSLSQPPGPAVSGKDAARVDFLAGRTTNDRSAQINYENSWSGTAAAPTFGGPIIFAPLPHIAPTDPLTRYFGRLVVTISGKMPRKALQEALNLAAPDN